MQQACCDLPTAEGRAGPHHPAGSNVAKGEGGQHAGPRVIRLPPPQRPPEQAHPQRPAHPPVPILACQDVGILRIVA